MAYCVDEGGEIYGVTEMYETVEQDDYVMKDKKQLKSLLDSIASKAGEEVIQPFLKKKQKDPSSEEEVYNSEDDVSSFL
eukprot:SAG22_NODE_2082_length_3036_cov_40.046646_5_plen_79_part_00